jgi:hypothetical protein
MNRPHMSEAIQGIVISLAKPQPRGKQGLTIHNSVLTVAPGA